MAIFANDAGAWGLRSVLGSLRPWTNDATNLFPMFGRRPVVDEEEEGQPPRLSYLEEVGGSLLDVTVSRHAQPGSVYCVRACGAQ